MSDKSAIEWTDATWTDPRGRTRMYVRVDKSRPGQQLRREMAAKGVKWCRVCEAWRSDVTKNGLCRAHERASYRALYASNRERMKAAKTARKRQLKALPEIAVGHLLEQFDNRCAYCRAAEPGTWDHVVPVACGGDTVPGNIVPACLTCNSSKRDRDVVEWAVSKGYDLDLVGDVTALVMS